ncbi:Acid stress protein IbaG [Thalassocella blandensis]|nr:Acid stress protein IbaG [Thalassocella blandensis]
MTPEEIKSALESAIPESQVDAQSDGSHIKLTVVSPAFAGLSPVKKQQLVYSVLQEAISSGAIHAVHMSTYTPDEWSARNA